MLPTRTVKPAPRVGVAPSGARALELLGFAGVLAVLAVLDLLGVPGAIDASLHRRVAAMAAGRPSQESVVLVAIDDETIARWGAPPYGWDRLGPLVAAIRRGQPVIVAFVEPGQRLARGGETPPPDLAAAIYAKQLLVPAPAGGAPQPALDLGGAVDRVPLAGTLDGEIVERSGLHASDPASLPVSTLAGGHLPERSAAALLDETTPGSGFKGKIVLVGITAPSVTPLWPTPIGPLAPAQIHAHALLGLTDGVAWRVAGAATGWLLAILAAGLVLFFLPRLDEVRALAFAGGAVALLALVDATLCARGTLLLGAARPALAILLGVLAAGFVERRRIRRGLDDLARELRLRDGDGPAGDDADFWRRVAELARLYLDCRSSIVAELPPERWHLSLRVLVGTSLGEIHEQRRDVRRGAYEEAARSLHPVWQDDFMSEKLAQRTLLVPLVRAAAAEPGRLLGFWMLNFPVDADLDATQLGLVRMLAEQVALAIDRRQEGQRAARAAAPSSTGALEDALDALAGDARRLVADHRDADRLLEELPAGVLVATLWGEVRTANATIRRLVAEAGILRFGGLSLADVLLALSGLGKDDVYARLQDVVRGGGELRLTGPAAQLSLGWLIRGEAEDAERLLLLCAAPAARAEGPRTPDFNDARTQLVPRQPTPPAATPLAIPSDPGSGATQAIRTVVESLHVQADDPTTAHVKLDADPPSRRRS